jgi:hypothetical protein
MFGKKKSVSKIKEPIYVSKLTGKRSNSVAKHQGVKIGYLQRCINIVRFDLNVLWSIWKPRIVYKDREPIDVTEDLYE